VNHRIAMLAPVVILALVAALAAAPLRAQAIDERLGGRVPPEIAALVRELAAEASARGLPVDPLIQKAIEGSAKAVPADRVAVALRAVLGHLDQSAAALRQAGLDAPDTVVIAAGAFALNAGLGAADIPHLAAGGSPAVTLRVAGTLRAIGVPAADVVELITAELQSGGSTAELLRLPAQVRAEVGRGATPAQAAAGLARAAAAGAPGRRGPPPTRPTPPPLPVPPPRP
jgi:hypothetical protein